MTTKKWRVYNNWQPAKAKLTDKQMNEIDEREGRKRFPAEQVDSMMIAGSSMLALKKSLSRLEGMLEIAGVKAWRYKGVITQLENILKALGSKLSYRQAVSINANTADCVIQLIPQPVDGCRNLTNRDYDRLTCAALGYCYYHCVKNEAQQRKCLLKPILDDNEYLQKCDFRQMGCTSCKYQSADVAWDEISEDKT